LNGNLNSPKAVHPFPMNPSIHFALVFDFFFLGVAVVFFFEEFVSIVVAVILSDEERQSGLS
jgi:hypothetical protein